MTSPNAKYEERISKYWICDECAKKKNWTCEGIVTVRKGLCGWCKREDETTLTPCCDFNGPNGKRAIDD